MSTLQNYIVAQGGSVAFKGSLFKPGQSLPAGVPPTVIERLLAERRIIAPSAAPVASAPPADPAGSPPRIGVGERTFREKGTSVDAESGTVSVADARAKLNAERTARGEAPIASPSVVPTAPAVVEQAPPQAPAAPGIWSHDPDGLVGKPIDELRQLARDIDSTIEVNHLDEVELVALLSADYQAPQQTQS